MVAFSKSLGVGAILSFFAVCSSAALSTNVIIWTPWPDDGDHMLYCQHDEYENKKEEVNPSYLKGLMDAYLSGKAYQDPKTGIYTATVDTHWTGVKLVGQFSVKITTDFINAKTNTVYTFHHAGTTWVSDNAE